VSHITLQLDGDKTCYEPGAQVIATADWDLDQPATAVELRLMWQTSGKGDTDSSVVQEVSFDNPEQRGQKRLGIQLPDSPYSFSGKLVSLMWQIELEAVPSGETDRVYITLAPGGEEILLSSDGSVSKDRHQDIDDDDDDFDDDEEDEQ